MSNVFSEIRTRLQKVIPACSQPADFTNKEGALLTSQPTAKSPVPRILLLAVWFGLVAGMVEGTTLWIFRQQGWLQGKLVFLGISVEVVWISTIFDLLLFGVLGMALSLAARLLPRPLVLRLGVFLLAFLTFFDWLVIPLHGRISILAVGALATGLAVEASRWFHKYEENLWRLCRTSLPWLAVLALLALVGIQGGFWLQEQLAVARLPNAPPGASNVLVIVVDTLRADHLSSYGYERATSAHIDLLAEQGVLFENAFATSSWTPPSHASLLTGRYVHEHNADTEPLDARYPTIGEVLQERGYRTAAFSGNFETFNRSLGFGRGFHRFEDYYYSIKNLAVNSVYGRVIEFYLLHRIFGLEHKFDRKWASEVNGSLLRWIDRDREKPFFAFLNYYDVHAPYIPPQPFRGMFSELENPGGIINTDWGMDHIYVPMTPEQLQGEIDAYDGAIAYVDYHIGQLLSELQKRQLLGNTLVVITSDHGESFGEHGLLEHHNSLYREVIHVPLIVWWPGHLPAGKRIDLPVSNAALPATLLDLLDESATTLFPGPSLAQLWETPEAGRDWLYPLAEVAQVPWVPAQHLTAHGALKSVISPQWHYIEHERFGTELYAWKTDPQELRNVVENPDLQAIVQEFKALLGRLWTGAARLAQ